MSIPRLALALLAALLGLGAWQLLRPTDVARRLAAFAPRVDPLWMQRCRQAGLPYPPDRVRFLALKEERLLEVHAALPGGPWRRLAAWPMTASSGRPGPKLREGDLQIPEGRYAIESLNPKSRFHVSLRVAYPSEEDRIQARRDGREHLGGDIMIHGGAASIGCIAIGDAAAEEAFTLAARTGPARCDILILPHDLRTRPDPPGAPDWMRSRYADLRRLAFDFELTR